MSEVVSIRNVSKAYSIYSSPRELIKEAVLGGVRHDVFWALKDISFAVHEGQRIGIIGPNGAGKSTLLKLITGNLEPTSGSISVDGTVSAMLSLTSFLNPDETGLENIRFNLIVNGAKKADIPELTEEIVDFTELGAFILAPVRTYSSGMQARLAFAITTSMTPDILVVDEVLGAGDAYFVGKATKRMIDLCNRGRALLFVSHAINAIQLLCDTVVWLDGGAIREIGPVNEVAAQYEAEYRRQEDEAVRTGNASAREGRANRISPDELVRGGLRRIRLTGKGGRLTDTHYIRRLSLEREGVAAEIPLAFVELDEGVVAALDLIHSEWGRPHDRRGFESRALSRRGSPLRGGHILVRSDDDTSSLPVRLIVDSTSVIGAEQLVAQRIDFAQGSWINLDESHRETLDDGWTRSVFKGVLEVARDVLHEEQFAVLLDEGRPDVEVVDTMLLVEGAKAFSAREGQPFSVGVRIRANRVVPAIDVNLTFNRTDGVYVFWQSSGLVGANLENVAGERTVWFDFDPNLFGPGDYEVTVELGNGFDPVLNFPHSEIYDRHVAALRLKIAREWPLIMYGTFRHHFPVRVELPEGEAAPPLGQLTENRASSEGQ